MRYKNSEVCLKFLEQDIAENHSGSLVSDGNKLMNYETCIAQWDNDYLYLNMTKYSPTTTTIQNKLHRMAKDIIPEERLIVMKDYIPRGTGDIVL